VRRRADSLTIPDGSLLALFERGGTGFGGECTSSAFPLSKGKALGRDLLKEIKRCLEEEDK